MSLRECVDCKMTGTNSDFYKSNSNKSGFLSWCKPCNTKRSMLWRARNIGRSKQYDLTYRLTHKANLAVASKTWHANLKRQVMNAYGGKCFCCGESNLEFLTIEHKNRDGHVHRKNIGRGQKFYMHLRDNDFPDYKLGVLCWNCNCARRFGNTCPHQRTDTYLRSVNKPQEAKAHAGV